MEYKLKLTQISPARFARLVTQLKWRLLEGGGQAYYELGVADSGALIGLTRADLEESLETLEEMAGEIGASVIVVKEIEVPSVMVALADKLSGYLDPETGEWADKMSSKRPRATRSDYGLSDTLSTATELELETETETSTVESSDDEDSLPLVTPARSSISPHPAFISSTRSVNSSPERQTPQSSPALFPLDDDLALFSMEPEPEYSDTENKVTIADPDIPDLDPELWVDLEISSVFKPRPIRKGGRVMNAAVGHFGKRAHKLKQKKVHPWHGNSPPYPYTTIKGDQDDVKTRELRAHNRRVARDKRREDRRKLLHVAAEVTTSGASAVPSLPVDVSVHEAEKETDGLVSGLEALHVTADKGAPEISELLTHGTDTTTAEEDVLGDVGPIAQAIEGKLSGSGNLEPRLIVEALVVRKLSVDEGLFDFANLDSLMLS